MRGTMAITMAGLGSRFSKAGYDRPKYEIEVLGHPLFDWSMTSVNAFQQAGWTYSFAVPAGRNAEAYVRSRAKVLGLDVSNILTMKELTDGQATTALHLARAADQKAPFAIYNIDTFVAPSALAPPVGSADADGRKLDGWIPCFPGPGDGWSFVRLDEHDRVVEVREKQRISEHATVGLYWFASAELYRRTYDTYFSVAGREEKGERYVAPMYNQLIADGGRVEIARLSLDDVGMLGTPEQVTAFTEDPPQTALDWIR